MGSQITEELRQFIKSHGVQIIGIGDLMMYKFDENPPMEKIFLENLSLVYLWD